MRVQILISLAFVWIVGGIISDIMEGQMLNPESQQVIQDMTAYKILDSQGFMGIPIMGIEFFKEFTNLISFKYDWLTGGFMMFRFIIMCVAMGIIGILGLMFLPGLFTSAGGLIRWFR